MQSRRVVASLILLGASLVLVAGVGASSRAAPIAVGTNINVTKLAGSDAEATVAINPANTQQAFTVVNRFTARRTSDGGGTWSSAGSGVDTSCCDNAAAWDSFGNLFLINLNLKPGFVVDAAPLYLSTNGGKSFTKLRTMNTSPNIDQPTLKAGSGAVWATWNQDGTIYARGAAVTGLGVVGPFTAHEPVPGSKPKGAVGHPRPRNPRAAEPAPGSEGGFGQFGDIAIGPSGQVVVTYQSDTAIYANTDADGLGAGGFGSQVLVSSTNVDKFDAITPQPNRTIDAEANLAYDTSGGTHNGRLYIVYTNESPDESDHTDIFIRHSDNDGASWSSALKVNDDATTRAQFLPYLAVDQTNGDLIVTWYDARNDPTNATAQYWGAISEDGGATFGANFQISAGTSDANASGDGFDFGDYTWVDFHDGVALPVWYDNSNSTGDNPDGAGAGLDLYTARVEVGDFCLGSHATIVGTTAAGETINGTPGNDVIVGLGGDDTINGLGGNDKICGGGGSDTLNGGPGNDMESGGDNNDTFDQEAATNGADVLIGGNGTDTASYAARTQMVTVTLDGKANDGAGGKKKGGGNSKKGEMDNVQVENVTAGSKGGTITGDAGANVLTGGTGKDTLKGQAGPDTLNAVDGIGGNDSVDGGSDADFDTCNVDAGDKIKNCP